MHIHMWADYVVVKFHVTKLSVLQFMKDAFFYNTVCTSIG